MTITYMAMPVNKLTLGATALENTLFDARVIRNENGYDTATITLPDTTYYPSTVTKETTVLLEVKDETDETYTTLFVGIVKFLNATVGKDRKLVLSCVGVGAGLSEMLVAAEYGSQSTNKLTTLQEILTDSSNGIVPNFVNKILGGASSNYDYYYSTVDDLTGDIPYILFPYKPADKCLTDLCDLLTALGDGSTAGPHWIVTYDAATGHNYLRLKKIDTSQTGWTKYYGNSQANATLTAGTDYTAINLEPMAAEANHVVYYGIWRRPSNGTAWTTGTNEAAASDWATNEHATATFSNTYTIVDTTSLKIHQDSGAMTAQYPSSPASWNFAVFAATEKPTLKFYVYNPARGLGFAFYVRLIDADGHSMLANLTSDINADDEWFHFEFPIGTYYKQIDTPNKWGWKNVGGTFDWSNISHLQFEENNVVTGTQDWYIAGVQFGGANVCREAALANYTGKIVRSRIITDDVGKDDSLTADDDSGLLAQLAYSELLRLQSEPTVGTLETGMIKDILPGQWLYIQNTDYRVTQITHTINSSGYRTKLNFTDDVLNHHSRMRYDDINKVFSSIRTDMQDRQAASIKAGKIDINVARLTKTY